MLREREETGRGRERERDGEREREGERETHAQIQRDGGWSSGGGHFNYEINKRYQMFFSVFILVTSIQQQ